MVAVPSNEEASLNQNVLVVMEEEGEMYRSAYTTFLVCKTKKEREKTKRLR